MFDNRTFYYLNSFFDIRMALVYKIQEFLKRKFNELNLKRKEFARNSGIPYSTVINITKGLRLNIDISNILKIANYFKCSMDEVVGRNNYALSYRKTQVFFDLSPKDVSTNLREFIKRKSEQQKFNIYVLSKNIGYNEETLHKFVKNDSKRKALSGAVTVALADYFQVSLDEMVGRIKPATSDNNEPSQQQTSE
ncbi:MAG: helix-turn-helix domain-containing protein [Rickettsia endosymbiont of Pseudomimeciton antennatum]|nr:helix-turn-helix domain-containing protein [Rickettsia endosymbiont of Pseudomimeciton antennatum]